MLFADNGRTSSSKCTCHFIFSDGQINKGYAKVAVCPKTDILGDFFTKQLQGSLYPCMLEKFLNLSASVSNCVHRSELEDRKNEVAISYPEDLGTPNVPGDTLNSEPII